MSAVSRVAVIGEGVRVQGFTLAGALVFAADDAAGARAAWRSLPLDVEVAVLTPAAAHCPASGPTLTRVGQLIVGPWESLSHTGRTQVGVVPLVSCAVQVT